MSIDQKKYLRANERVATVVDLVVHRNAAGGRVTCVALELEDGTPLGDHFNSADQGSPGIRDEQHRWEALRRALQSKEDQPAVGRQVIVVLDRRGVIEDYFPILADQE